MSFIVAPFEADSQLYYLAKKKHIDLVITEDSDLLAYGTPRVMFKWNKNPDRPGVGDEIDLSTIAGCSKLDLVNFRDDDFLNMCILSGCDYLDSMGGMGMVGACKTVGRFLNVANPMRRIFQTIRFENKYRLPKHYEDRFEKARLTFRHARVWDPDTMELVHLRPLPKDVDFDVDFLGPLMSSHDAREIAEGRMNPFTRRAYTEADAAKFAVPADASYSSKQPRTFMVSKPAKKSSPPAKA